MTQIRNMIQSPSKDLGDGFVVRRGLPHLSQKTVGPFVFWDHFGPVELKSGHELKVRAHPHIGLATLSYLFSGEIMHRDSLGYEQAITPGAVNWMTAGAGIVHSERTRPAEHVIGQQLEGIQLWIGLPKEEETRQPSFQHYPDESIPEVDIEGQCLKLIAGRYAGKTSPVAVYSPLFYMDTILPAGRELKLPVERGHEGALYIAKGSGQVEDQAIDAHQLVTFKKDAPLVIKSTSDQTRVLFFGGEPFPEPRTIWWNFVSSDKELIEKAIKRWTAGEFPRVINEDEWIPLPDH